MRVRNILRTVLASAGAAAALVAPVVALGENVQPASVAQAHGTGTYCGEGVWNNISSPLAVRKITRYDNTVVNLPSGDWVHDDFCTTKYERFHYANSGTVRIKIVNYNSDGSSNWTSYVTKTGPFTVDVLDRTHYSVSPA